nr:MAG TPA: hypothetical protein [Caudoviricetes sp.]
MSCSSNSKKFHHMITHMKGLTLTCPLIQR